MGNWKRLASILLVGTMTVTLAACGSSSSGSKDEGGGKDEKVKLNVLFNNTDENVEKEMAYVQEHLPEKLPNVEVEFEMSPGDAQTYETKGGFGKQLELKKFKLFFLCIMHKEEGEENDKPRVVQSKQKEIM